MTEATVENCPSGIYCIRNTISGRVYVGSAVRIKQRWGAHRHLLNAGKHHAIALQRSWLKHGPDAFAWTVLERVPVLTDLLACEQRWIDALKAADRKRGFNVHPNAASPLGRRHRAETKAKWSAARKGRKHGPRTAEQRAALSAACIGRPSPRKGAVLLEETRERIRAARQGATVSVEARAKMSAARKGRKLGPATPEHRAAISAARKRLRLPLAGCALASVKAKAEGVVPPLKGCALASAKAKAARDTAARLDERQLTLALIMESAP